MQNRYLILLLMALLTGTAVQAQQKTPLHELNLKLMTTGYGQVRANRSCDGNPITLCGKQYPGVGTHAESKIIIALQGKGRRFTALAGVDDEATARGSVQFKITGDGKLLFLSPLQRKGDKPAKINISLKGIDTLILEALPGKDGNNNDHADWADAWFEMKSGKPVAIPEYQVIDLITDSMQLTLGVDKSGNV